MAPVPSKTPKITLAHIRFMIECKNDTKRMENLSATRFRLLTDLTTLGLMDYEHSARITGNGGIFLDKLESQANGISDGIQSVIAAAAAANKWNEGNNNG